MPMDILLGLQWGDEGKGKVVDFLAPKYRVVARFQGGPNAGHTLVHSGVKHVLHQVPSGIFHSQILNVIGNGVVLDPVVFRKEIDNLHARGLKPEENLIISRKAQLIVPTHRLLDAASEKSKGDAKIGSTLKGIGPAYQDKYARAGLRVGDVLRADFRERYEAQRAGHFVMLDFLQCDTSPLAEMEADWFAAIERLKAFPIEDTEYVLNDALRMGKDVLAEGAQGSLLDIDFGSYPFVTSSSTMAAGACIGLGVAPQHVREVYGIFKAYCTRVGSGPFPTELHDAVGEQIRKQGHEFGSTTGRPRRTGWLDLPALKYACMLSGVTQLMMMKADVLAGMEPIQVCTGYELDGGFTDHYPAGPEAAEVSPVYQSVPGWPSSPTPETYEAFPTGLRQYIEYIEGETGLPVSLISNGPDRDDTLLR